MQNSLRKPPDGMDGGPLPVGTSVFAPYHYHAVAFAIDHYLIPFRRIIAQHGEVLLRTLGKVSPVYDFFTWGQRR